MSRPQLKLACTDNDRNRAILDGTVQIEGADVVPRVVNGAVLFRDQAREKPYDIAEFSSLTLMALYGQGDRSLVAIPVFPSRNFRHHNFLVNVRSGVERPQDLVGKRIGCAEWVQTAALWMRAVLTHDYGVEQDQVTWVFGPPQEDRIEFDYPRNLRIERAPAGTTLDELLERGEIDALMSASYPRYFIEGTPNVRRLFPDYKAVQADYYRRTGLFPIMHLVVIRRDVYEQYPWLAVSVQQAFTRSRDLALEELYRSWEGILTTILPLLVPAVEETRELLGEDFWSYGFAKNRHVLDAMTRYAYEQGITPARLQPEDLFAPETQTG